MATDHNLTSYIPDKSGITGCFFITPGIPFVGNSDTNVLPFVGKNIPSSRIDGFTLIEMIVTLVVVAILTAVAMPQMRALFQNNRLTTQANSFISDITMARDQAMGKGMVVICTSSTGAACDGSGWGSGRLIFVDAQPNNFTFDAATDRVIRFTDPLPAGSIDVPVTTFPDPLIFNPQGAMVDAFQQRVLNLANAPGAGASLSLNLCDAGRYVPGRLIEIRTNGTPVINSVTPAVCP